MYVFDSTLRDGTQGEGVSFTVKDKVKIVKILDKLGIDYIEGGNPGSNPKDTEFFEEMRNVRLKNSKLVAFGSTRRPHIKAKDDANVEAILNAETDVVAIFGKSWDFHVTHVLRTTCEENLEMIKDTIAYLKANGKEVVFDAEHFFDGYKANPEYAMAALRAAEDAGADWLVLCDTNGGTFPSDVGKITRLVKDTFSTPIGIHCHDDGGMAVANSIAAVEEGATQVQGTINGYGERCGNANLSIIVPNLQIKMGKSCVPEKRMKSLTSVSRYVDEIANLQPVDSMPYVGNSAFAHKGGMHIDAILKEPISFEHIEPVLVGNERRILMSEVAGRSTVLRKIQRIDPSITKDCPETHMIIDELKQLEYEGYQFEGAEGSFELMIMRILGEEIEFFDVKSFKVFSEDHWSGDYSASAIVKLEVDGVDEITAAEGDGPVNALDLALRKALEVFYPQLKAMKLTDYKVRVLDATKTTASMVRVHIESADGKRMWGTVGVSTNIIEASWIALVDSIEYYLYHEKEWKELDRKMRENNNQNNNNSLLNIAKSAKG